MFDDLFFKTFSDVLCSMNVQSMWEEEEHSVGTKYANSCLPEEQ